MQQLQQRRRFLTLGSLSFALILTSGCSLFGITSARTTIDMVQGDLLPKAKALGINTSSYISIIYKHEKIATREKQFLKNGVKWLHERSFELYKTSYTKLPAEKRQALLRDILKSEWGSNWIDMLLRYTLEAMLGDPIYGGNQNEAGWKWLAFEGGKPRAKRAYL